VVLFGYGDIRDPLQDLLRLEAGGDGRPDDSRENSRRCGMKARLAVSLMHYEEREAMLIFVALLVAQAQPATAVQTSTLPKSGVFGAGFQLELPSVGPCQVMTGHGVATGITLMAAVQADVGPRWAWRLQIAAHDATRAPLDDSFFDFGVTPGVLYRWRQRTDQTWIPYAGAGLRIASQAVRRDLVGEPLLAIPSCSHHCTVWNDRNDVVDDVSLAPELWFGVDMHPARWLAVNFGGAYVAMRAHGTVVHLLRETVALRLTF
jgi:hypothetical protein